jgi:hypothetical protein
MLLSAAPRTRRVVPIWLIGLLVMLLGMKVSARAGEAEEKNAHPFHICIGEMEWNQETLSWEVSLRIHPDDLQRAVSRCAGERIELKLGEESQPQVMSYLQSHFYLRSGDEGSNVRQLDSQGNSTQASQSEASRVEGSDSAHTHRSTLKWHGSEMEKGWMWIYLELTPPQAPGPLHLVHEVLLDDVEKQSNTMVILRGDKKQSLRFWKDMRERPFEGNMTAALP